MYRTAAYQPLLSTPIPRGYLSEIALFQRYHREETPRNRLAAVSNRCCTRITRRLSTNVATKLSPQRSLICNGRNLVAVIDCDGRLLRGDQVIVSRCLSVELGDERVQLPYTVDIWECLFCGPAIGADAEFLTGTQPSPQPSVSRWSAFRRRCSPCCRSRLDWAFSACLDVAIPVGRICNFSRAHTKRPTPATRFSGSAAVPH